MIRNLETESLAFGDDDEFYRRLDEFNRYCFERIRKIPWIILSIPFNCCSFLKYVASSIKDIFLRQYIAVIILVLSSSTFPVSIVVLRDDERIITAIYSLPFITCSVLSLLSNRGMVIFARKSRSELVEHQQLLGKFNSRNGQEADQPARYGAKDKRQPSKRASKNLMEPRQGRKAHPAIDFHRSISHTQLNCIESSAGPSHAPECSDWFTITNINGYSYDSDEPFQRLSVARISADAVKTFGPPLQVFGADSYRVVLHSSDENCSDDEPVDVKVKHFEVPVEVHPFDSHRPLNSCNDGSSSAEPASVTND